MPEDINANQTSTALDQDSFSSMPLSGRVVIVDDMVSEGLPLLNVLSKHRIPYQYFTGDPNGLPDKPIKGIRIIFLDIDLEIGRDDKTKISKVLNVLKQLIGKENGPYFIIAWAKDDDLIKTLQERIGEEFKDSLPLDIISLDKGEFFESKAGANNLLEWTLVENGIQKIEKKIKDLLGSLKAFHIFLIWENIIHKSAGETVQTFYSLLLKEEDWDKAMCSVFRELAFAYMGKQLDVTDTNEVSKNALYAFNSTFLDSVEDLITKHDFSKNFDKIDSSSKVDVKHKAIINNKLLLITSTESSLPGNIYEVKEGLDKKPWCKLIADILDFREIVYSLAKAKSIDLYTNEELHAFKKKYRKEYEELEEKKREEIRSKLKYIFLEVSPTCDFVQKKWEVHRIVPGVLWHFENLELIGRRDNIYISPLIEFKNELYKMVFEFRYFGSKQFEELKEHMPIFRIRHGLLVDIQSNLAKHVNRPGVVFLE